MALGVPAVVHHEAASLRLVSGSNFPSFGQIDPVKRRSRKIGERAAIVTGRVVGVTDSSRYIRFAVRNSGFTAGDYRSTLGGPRNPKRVAGW